MYHFYFQQTDKDGNASELSPRDLESYFSGVSYLSCKGLESVGKPKNIYTESYAEHNGVRSYHPSDNSGSVTHEATKVELDLVIQGSSRRTVFNQLCEYLSQKRVYYWDTARNKKVWLMLSEEVTPTDDTLKGIRYIRATFTFTNLWGISKTCDDSGNVSTSQGGQA